LDSTSQKKMADKGNEIANSQKRDLENLLVTEETLNVDGTQIERIINSTDNPEDKKNFKKFVD